MWPKRFQRIEQYPAGQNIQFVITGIGYDAVRYPRAAWVSEPCVLSCGLRDAEVAVFGVGPNLTIQDWFAAHHCIVMDVVCAVPYFAFAYVVLGYATYLYFADRPRMSRFLWSYAVANFIAFGFWLLVPAAPPWYVRAHGCAIDLSVAPSAAALSRVDALLGFYSRSTSVFGALPSMHCAFPLLGLLTAWKHVGWRTRPIHVAYTLLMALSAVYLDHHWVIDVLAGWTVAALAVVLADKLLRVWGPWFARLSATGAMHTQAELAAGRTREGTQ